MVSPAIYPRVYTEEEKEGRKTEKWKATHPRLILLFSLSLESHRCPESSLANPSFQENATGLSPNRRDGTTVFSGKCSEIRGS